MQALVWLLVVWFRETEVGMALFPISYMNLKWSHISNTKFMGKNLVLHFSECSIMMIKSEERIGMGWKK